MEYSSLILVVDDQASGRKTLASLLEPEGYRIAFATSGPEALAMARLLAPDLVLLDVMMPEMDGFEVCRRLRDDPTLALVPVVMVTALDDTESLIQGFEAGADDFVSKPFQRVALRARIRTITRLNRFRALLEGQRRAANERAQLLWAIEHASDGYVLLDDEGRLQYCNAQARRYLGLPALPAALPEYSFIDLGNRRFQLEPTEAWDTWPQQTAATRYLVRPGSPDPRWLTVDLLNLPSGFMGSYFVRLQDVTAQVEAQRILWSFHSFVSHKLRTPLTSLLVGMELLQKRAPSLLSADLVPLFEIAYVGSQQLNGVVNDIFRYLNVPVESPPRSGCLLSQVPPLAIRISTELGITNLEVSVTSTLKGHRLTVSASTIEILLTELLENARKFHPNQMPGVMISMGVDDTTATIRIADNGISLSPEQLTRLWEPYFQIDPDDTGQIPGLGLGMATVARVVWSVGGTCRVSSQSDGPGLIVELVLPLEVESCCTPVMTMLTSTAA